MTMSEDQVAIWAASYPICAHVTLAIESMYSADDEMKEEKRKEEGEKRRILDTDDRNSCLRRDEEAFPPSQMTSSSLIDEYGCLRTGTKSILVSNLKVDEGRRSCWSSCNAWSWHTPCTTDQLPAVSSDVNSRPSLLICCLPEHYLVVCSPDVICQISVYRWKSFDIYSFPSCPFGVEGIRGRSHAFTCSNSIERANKFAFSL